MTEDCRQLCLCTLLSKSAVPPEHLQVLSISYELSHIHGPVSINALDQSVISLLHKHHGDPWC